MTPSSATPGFGPGWSRQDYLGQLASTGYTGWYDNNGVPAPWPEDFLDPDSGWQPTTTGGDTTTINPDCPF